MYSWRLHEYLQQIAAGRVVRRLNNFAYTGPEMQPYVCVSIGKVVHAAILIWPRSTEGSTVGFRSDGFRAKRSTHILKDSVHVHVSYKKIIMCHETFIIFFLDGNFQICARGW